MRCVDLLIGEQVGHLSLYLTARNPQTLPACPSLH